MMFEDLDSKMVETRYGQIHALVHIPLGAKLSFVFLHGLRADVRSWKRLIPYLGDGIGIVLIDMLGHGESDAPHIDYTPEVQASAVLEVVSKLVSGSYVVVGNSYGGWITAYGAATGAFGKNISGIVLEDAAGLREEMEDTLKSMSYDEFYSMQMKKISMLNRNEVGEGHDYVVSSIIGIGNTKYLLGSKELGRIKDRCIVIWGTDDKIIDKKYAYAFGKYINGSELVFIDGGGHVPHFLRPSEFAQALKRFG
ncbi:alpha/beta hydrolase [Candidatus Marsarchaeota archaeon]|nr:alpha/beta hydrolase [Candidatus Marsarchaeota archaeon]